RGLARADAAALSAPPLRPRGRHRRCHPLPRQRRSLVRDRRRAARRRRLHRGLVQHRDSDGVDRRFGSGWISGMLSVAFAGLGYGGVLCLLFPWRLTTPDARPLYPLSLVRALIHAFLVAGFGLGVLSVLLRRRDPK